MGTCASSPAAHRHSATARDPVADSAPAAGPTERRLMKRGLRRSRKRGSRNDVRAIGGAATATASPPPIDTAHLAPVPVGHGTREARLSDGSMQAWGPGTPASAVAVHSTPEGTPLSLRQRLWATPATTPVASPHMAGLRVGAHARTGSAGSGALNRALAMGRKVDHVRSGSKVSPASSPVPSPDTATSKRFFGRSASVPHDPNTLTGTAVGAAPKHGNASKVPGGLQPLGVWPRSSQTIVWSGASRSTRGSAASVGSSRLSATSVAAPAQPGATAPPHHTLVTTAVEPAAAPEPGPRNGVPGRVLPPLTASLSADTDDEPSSPGPQFVAVDRLETVEEVDRALASVSAGSGSNYSPTRTRGSDAADSAGSRATAGARCTGGANDDGDDATSVPRSRTFTNGSVDRLRAHGSSRSLASSASAGVNTSRPPAPTRPSGLGHSWISTTMWAPQRVATTTADAAGGPARMFSLPSPVEVRYQSPTVAGRSSARDHASGAGRSPRNSRTSRRSSVESRGDDPSSPAESPARRERKSRTPQRSASPPTLQRNQSVAHLLQPAGRTMTVAIPRAVDAVSESASSPSSTSDQGDRSTVGSRSRRPRWAASMGDSGNTVSSVGTIGTVGTPTSAASSFTFGGRAGVLATGPLTTWEAMLGDEAPQSAFGWFNTQTAGSGRGTGAANFAQRPWAGSPGRARVGGSPRHDGPGTPAVQREDWGGPTLDTSHSSAMPRALVSDDDAVSLASMRSADVTGVREAYASMLRSLGKSGGSVASGGTGGRASHAGSVAGSVAATTPSSERGSAAVAAVGPTPDMTAPGVSPVARRSSERSIVDGSVASSGTPVRGHGRVRVEGGGSIDATHAQPTPRPPAAVRRGGSGRRRRHLRVRSTFGDPSGGGSADLSGAGPGRGFAAHLGARPPPSSPAHHHVEIADLDI